MSGGLERRVVELGRELAYQGHFRIVRWRLRHSLFAGGLGPPLSREVFERGHAVAVLPYDPERDAVVLVEQFPIGAAATGWADPWLVEIVAGIVEAGENAKTVARREAREEAGLTLHDLTPVAGFFVSPGGTSEFVRVYCARVDASQADGIHGLADEGEDIRVLTLPYAEAMVLLAQGRIVSSPALVALQWLQSHRKALRAHWCS
ncbi:MAG: NUDIX domain-containing protein [Alphaproteobacteria bacterium]|nr:NUDIX domain-containing protein [Alphaproteobacteria bacterium]